MKSFKEILAEKLREQQVSSAKPPRSSETARTIALYSVKSL